MIVFLNTRMYCFQRRYMDAAYREESEDKVFVDLQNCFIHCDNQNVPKSFIKAIVWFFKTLNITLLIPAIKHHKKIVTCIKQKKSKHYIDNKIISIEGMVSHLAKRHKSSNLNKLAEKKLDIFILTYDQLVFNNKFELIKNRFNERLDTFVVFNGRVSPERLIQNLWNGKIKYVEQGFREKYYYGDLSPVSKKRWDYELRSLRIQSLKKKRIPRPKKVILFLTSPYEFMFADRDYQSSVGNFQSQYAVLEAYVNICNELKLTPLVKFHPRNPRKMFLQDHSKDNFSFEFVETNVDAEFLIKESDVVVLSSSSLAIKCASLKKPSCYGLTAFYENASVSVATKNKASLRDFLRYPYLLEGAEKRAEFLEKGFAKTAPLDKKISISRYLKRIAIGH